MDVRVRVDERDHPVRVGARGGRERLRDHASTAGAARVVGGLDGTREVGHRLVRAFACSPSALRRDAGDATGEVAPEEVRGTPVSTPAMPYMALRGCVKSVFSTIAADAATNRMGVSG
jgi:hypothetical protein